MPERSTTAALTAAFAMTILLVDSANAADSVWVRRGVTGQLIYTPDAEGDRILDFSDAGYRGGREAIPDVPTVRTASAVSGGGDDTARLQALIDEVAALPIGPDGYRGAVRLGAGEFRIHGQLRIRDSGVVLRGSGAAVGGTVLRAVTDPQAPQSVNDRPLIQIEGSGSHQRFGRVGQFVDKVVPAGSRSFRVDSTAGFAVGDTVTVERPGTQAWISALGTDQIPPRSDGGTVNQWQPDEYDLRYDRTITRIEGDRVFVDAPLPTAFTQEFGGGTIQRHSFAGRINNVGVENLRGVSDFASPTDENHSWNFVLVDRARDVFVRDTVSENFAFAAVTARSLSSNVTVRDARNLTPRSQVTGGRRYSFDLSGELGLVTRVEANDGRHDFVNNDERPRGPNVFHRSVANNAQSDTGPHQRWATGTLFDNITVRGDDINVRNRGNFGTGHGWAGGNIVVWNSEARRFAVQNPPTSQNWLVGSIGRLRNDTRFGQQPPGYVDSHGERVSIDSLYEAQLEDAADVTVFTWSGGDADWGDPDAWAQRLAPGAYRLSQRDYLIGDIDGFTDDGAGSVDDAFIDPAWRALIESGSSNPIRGFDESSTNRNAAFTARYTLDPGERVVHGSLALSLIANGGGASNDFVRLFNADPENRFAFSDLGWANQINTSDPFVGVLDLGDRLDELQGGSLNVQVNDDTAVDWALYTATVATPTAAGPAAVLVAGGGEATISNDVGGVGSLTIGDAALRLAAGGAVRVDGVYEQSSAGVLRLEVDDAGSAAPLEIAGDALLDGLLEVFADEDYTAEAGDVLPLLSVDGLISGAFDSVVLPGVEAGLRWSLVQDASSLLAVVSSTADFNTDGVVNASDFTVWRDLVGSNAAPTADSNGDGQIDLLDNEAWRAAFGAGGGGSAGAAVSLAVPEPASAVLTLAFATLAVIARRR